MAAVLIRVVASEDDRQIPRGGVKVAFETVTPAGRLPLQRDSSGFPIVIVEETRAVCRYRVPADSI